VADAAGDTFGNPCPVIDRASGTILLLLTKSPGEKTEAQIIDGPSAASTTVWLCRSQDDGATWSPPTEITTQAKRRTWTWYGTGPGVGLTLASGRLFVPSYHAEAETKIYKAHSLFSDDHGTTWQIGADVADHTTEPQAAVRADGTLVINCRSVGKQGFRTIATSSDGGVTWSAAALDKTLTDPSCQGSLLALSGGRERSRWLFSNPPGPLRRDLTVRLSYDEGKTWEHRRILEPIGSEYSCLCRLAGGEVGILYERNPGQIYAPHVTFARFDLAWLTEGTDRGDDLAPSR
jgi:sialidase-1